MSISNQSIGNQNYIENEILVSTVQLGNFHLQSAVSWLSSILTIQVYDPTDIGGSYTWIDPTSEHSSVSNVLLHHSKLVVTLEKDVLYIGFPPRVSVVITLCLKDECPVNALRAQNLAGGHFLGHEIRLVFVSLGILAILGIN